MAPALERLINTVELVLGTCSPGATNYLDILSRLMLQDALLAARAALIQRGGIQTPPAPEKTILGQL